MPTSLGGIILPHGEIDPLNAINPNDIESIEIFKDADVTAIYGSRGARSDTGNYEKRKG
nr:TonB-dependent receptor plug domain-containing protein [uncultured Draconibacterium sp.]